MWTRQQENLARERSILDYQFELGFKQGLEQGRAKIRKEEREKRERGAKILLRRGETLEDVALISSFTLAEVFALKKEIDADL